MAGADGRTGAGGRGEGGANGRSPGRDPSARFRLGADAYGADLTRWPDERRAEAEAFAARHPAEAEAALQEAARLDGALEPLFEASRAAPAPSDAAIARILADADAVLAERAAQASQPVETRDLDAPIQPPSAARASGRAPALAAQLFGDLGGLAGRVFAGGLGVAAAAGVAAGVLLAPAPARSPSPAAGLASPSPAAVVDDLDLARMLGDALLAPEPTGFGPDGLLTGEGRTL